MLYKRPGSQLWWVKLKHHGKPVRRSTGTANRREAEKVERALRSSLRLQRKTEGWTFQDAATRWLKEKEHKRSLDTDQMILDWLLPLIGDFELSSITRDRVEMLRTAKLQEAGKSSVNRYMALLRSILKTARDDWEWIDRTPKVPMYSIPKREPRFLTYAQFVTLATELPPHLASPAWFAVSTGLRTKAIQLLSWDWISRDGVSFPPSVMKNANRLTIPLSPTAWYVVAEQDGGQMSRTDFVFVNHAGQPWAGKFTTRAWKQATKRAELDDVTFHDLRHTFASWKLQEGVPEHVVMALGGWESREAFKIYARFSTQSLQKWVT